MKTNQKQQQQSQFNSLLGKSSAVHDDAALQRHRRISYGAYFIIGCGLELPYLSLLSGIDLFQALFGPKIEYELTIAFDPFCFVAYCVLFARVCCTVHHFPRTVLFTGFGLKFVFMCLSMAAITLIKGLHSHVSILAIMLCISLFTALDHLTIFAHSAEHSEFTEKLMQGLSYSGALISVFRIGSKVFFPTTLSGLVNSTLLYFGMAGAWCLLCVVCANFVTSKHAIHLNTYAFAGTDHSDSTPSIIYESAPLDIDALYWCEEKQKLIVAFDNSRVTVNHAVEQKEDVALPTTEEFRKVFKEADDELIALVLSFLSFPPQTHTMHPPQDPIESFRSSSKHSPQSCFQASKQYVLLVFFTYCSTYIIFPGVLSNIQSEREYLNYTGWTSVLNLSMFNFANLFGSLAVDRWNYMSYENMTFILFLKVFIGFYFVKAVSLNWWCDWLNVSLILFWGASTGYVGTMASGLALETVHSSSSEQQMVGEIISGAFNLGITTGTVLSFLIATTLFF